MKYLDEFRDRAVARELVARIRRKVTRPWVIMEICGGQTHAIVRHGIDRALTSEIELVHGPGCPVCVTPLESVDRAIAIAQQPDVIFASFGDMLRVPGSRTDLHGARAQGADVRIVYSPLEAVKLARENPDRQVVFFAIGFETTAPATAIAVWQARTLGLANFSLLVSHVLVPPAIKALMQSDANRIQGLLLAGHVCSVTGWAEYEAIARKHSLPMVVAGFEPGDILAGILTLVKLLEDGAVAVRNEYARVVQRDGNRNAWDAVQEVFEVADRPWRGIGVIPDSGLRLREACADYDADRRFNIPAVTVAEPAECINGLVLQGAKKPYDCPAFGTRCSPESPLGATMVSSEGACAAYYRYVGFGRRKADERK